MNAGKILSASLVIGALSVVGCVSPPARQDDFEAGGTSEGAYDLHAGYVYSDNAKNAFEYMHQKCGGLYSAASGGRSVATMKNSFFPPILQSRFKTVTRFGTVEQAEAANVDVVVILDLYAKFSSGVAENYTLDMGAKFLAPGRTEIDVVKAHGGARGFVICGDAVPQAVDNASKAFTEALSRSAKFSDWANVHQHVPQAPIGAPSVAAARQSNLPASPTPNFSVQERPEDLAVIIGVEIYSDIASKAPYAERDADAFKAHVRALGVPERNIALLKGSKAGRASLEKNLESWLPRLAKPDSRVYFYFSGHGAPDVKTGQAYLVPWDGDPNFLENTAYPVARLYEKLGELPAKQVLVVMDSCFSGAGGRSVLASGARPLVGKIDVGLAPAKITVLAASASNEISGSLDDKGHGAFTYFLLQGLDAGKRTPKALAEYLTPLVQDEARRLNRDQTPQLQGDGAWSLR